MYVGCGVAVGEAVCPLTPALSSEGRGGLFVAGDMVVLEWSVWREWSFWGDRHSAEGGGQV